MMTNRITAPSAFAAALGLVALLLTGAAAADSQGQSYAEAAADAAACDTNYGEVVRTAHGYEAYCVPDESAEACIEVSSLLDCSALSADACDDAMGSMFAACVVLYRSAEAVR